MSYQRAVKTARREPVDRVALFENLDHPSFMRELLGWDPWDDPVRAYRDSYRELDVDWVVGVPRRSVRFAPGETSRSQDDALFTEWGLSGSHWRRDYRFHDEESVLAYDPLENRERDPLVTPEHNRNVLDALRSDQELMGDSALVTGVYYTTLFQFGIMIFDWELYLATAAAHPQRFQRVLEGFAEVSRRNLAEWARAGMEMVFIHDDIATERGLVFSPEWYRRRLFPLYERLLEPVIRRPGAPTVFVSDGNYTDVIDDLAALGFDGFVLNSGMDLGRVARRLGGRFFVAGNVSTTILTLGSPEDVRREVRRCVRDAAPAGGHFLHAGGDLPQNIPVDNMRAYFEAARELRR